MKFLAALLLAGCTILPAPAPPSKDGCEAACANQARLGCELGRVTPEGSSCVEVCANALDGPELFRWRVECLSAATACDSCSSQ